jgi:twitching motility protein PilT
MAYTAEGLPRFRVNVFRQRGNISFALRVIPRDVPSFEQLKLPSGVRRLAEEHRGLVLCTGATGSGKTTTLASMLDHINRTRHQHIVTIEDPIEILHPDRNCIVNQREVGLDTESFAQGLRRVLRQDPDTILIGELRDAETAQTALQAAESGHLVFSTLHTIDAAETVGRMIEFFPPAKQQQIRSVLAGVLRGVISQRLLPRVDGGRVAAVEVMVMNARISDLIREERTEEISDAVAEGAFFEMQTFQQALIEHVLAGSVERDVAANASSNHHDFLVALDHALKQQHADVAQVQAQERAAAAEADVPALRVARPAEV